MMCKITATALVVWSTIATAMLLLSIVGTAPWERRGLCLDALLRWNEAAKFEPAPISISEIEKYNFVRDFGLRVKPNPNPTKPPYSELVESFPMRLGLDDKMRYLYKIQDDLERWCG